MFRRDYLFWIQCRVVSKNSPSESIAERLVPQQAGHFYFAVVPLQRVLLLVSPISPCHTRIKEVLNFRCILLKFWSFESLLTGLEAAASNLSKWKSIGRKLPGHEEVLKSSRTFCRSFCSHSAFVKTKLWRIQISLLESVMLDVKQNYLYVLN